MKSDIVYMPFNIFKTKKKLAPLNLEVQESQKELKIILMSQNRLTDIEENERMKLIESLSNTIYPLYFYIQMPDIYLEEFKQLFNSNKNDYVIIKKLESNYFLSLKIRDSNNLQTIIKELAWLNGSGYILIWSTNPIVFISQNDKNGSIKMEENQSIFMIGEPEDLLIIITNENRFSSFKNIKQVLPSFVVPTLYEYD